MPIKITTASDPLPVEQITLTLYGGPGLGKTSTGFTAHKPILFDFDAGAYRSQFRKDTVQVPTWRAVASVTAEDLAAYDTVVIDTAGRALDSLTAELVAANAKLKGYGGASLSMQGWGALKDGFIGWLKLLHSFGKDVVLIAHMDEQRAGDNTVERLDVQGGSKAEIYKSADAMARLYLVAQKRTLNFNPTDTAFGKNPAQLAPILVPDFHENPNFLGGLIAEIKQKLNETSEAATAQQAILEDYRITFLDLTTAQEFTAKVIELAKADPPVKALLVAVAKEKGFTFNKTAKAFQATA